MHNERAIIYTITCFEKCESDERNWLKTGATRTFGFYTEREVAIQALHENWCDMFEYLYTFAVIEALCEGIHCDVEEEIWFRWDDERKGFFEIEKPACTNRFLNHSIG